MLNLLSASRATPTNEIRTLATSPTGIRLTCPVRVQCVQDPEVVLIGDLQEILKAFFRNVIVSRLTAGDIVKVVSGKL
jgi:hypothetical protein